MKNKRGISIIVLVITIIIIIILAGAVILNLADNNPIENASEAKIASDLDAFKSDLTIQIGQKYLENIMLDTEQIDSDETKDGWKIADLIPSIVGTGYEEQLIVENGELKLRIDSSLDKQTKEIIEEKLGSAVLTASMILENPKEYIGKQVIYTGYSENTNTIDWRLFGLDENGNIMLKANDYVDLSYKVSSYPSEIKEGSLSSQCINTPKVRKNLIDYIGSSANWNEYAISGKTIARGAMTLSEFANGYNLVNDVKIEIEELKGEILTTKDNTYTGGAEGYAIKKSTASSFGVRVTSITDTYNGMRFSSIPAGTGSWGYLLASASAHNAATVVFVYGDNRVSWLACGAKGGCLCPVVSLTTANITIDSEGNLMVE